MAQKVVNQFAFRCPYFFDEMYLVPGHDPEHRYNLLVKLAKKYLAIRVHKFIKNHNVETKNKVRKKLTKLVHFRNE